MAGRNHATPSGLTPPSLLMLSSSFSLLRSTGVLLLLSQDRMGQGLDQLDSSYAYKSKHYT